MKFVSDFLPLKEREKNGPYKDIYDFAERVDLSNVNRKAFESLAYSGGFDSFGLQREQFFGVSGRDSVFLDTIVRYGQLFQTEKAEQQNSLFGGMDAVAVMHPVAPKTEKWPTIEKLNKERELVGVYLSAHPLDERFSQKTGKPFGFVTIEDFEGTGELALFGDDWARWNNLLKVNYTIYITAKCQPRYRNNPSLLELKVQNVEQLYDVKEHKLQRFTISMDASSLDDELVSELSTVIDEHQGNTQLLVQLRTLENTIVTLQSRNKTVNVDRKLIDFITASDKMEFHIN